MTFNNFNCLWDIDYNSSARQTGNSFALLPVLLQVVGIHIIVTDEKTQCFKAKISTKEKQNTSQQMPTEALWDNARFSLCCTGREGICYVGGNPEQENQAVTLYRHHH